MSQKINRKYNQIVLTYKSYQDWVCHLKFLTLFFHFWHYFSRSKKVPNCFDLYFFYCCIFSHMFTCTSFWVNFLFLLPIYPHNKRFSCFSNNITNTQMLILIYGAVESNSRFSVSLSFSISKISVIVLKRVYN